MSENNSVKEVLEAEVLTRMEELSNMGKIDKDYVTAVEGVAKLIDKATVLDQQEFEQDYKLSLQCEELNLKEAELELKKKQSKVDMWHKVAMVGVAIGGAALTAVINVWGTNKCLDYDASGNIVTTTPGRKWTDRLFKS